MRPLSLFLCHLPLARSVPGPGVDAGSLVDALKRPVS